VDVDTLLVYELLYIIIMSSNYIVLHNWYSS